MKITKLTVSGQRQKISDVAVPTPAGLHLKDSILVSGTVRGDGKQPELRIEDGDLIELVYDDDTTWLCPPDTLEDIYPGSFTKNRSGDASFQIPADLDHPDTSRSFLGKAALKVLNLFSGKAVAGIVDDKVKGLALDLEQKQMGKYKGLVRVNRSFELEKMDGFNPNNPFLLFIHGTNSSTSGSFAELLGTELWDHIIQSYDRNIIAFQHETLTKSPLENAFDLVKQLPPNIDLHIISHSRGGLVGEILCRFSGSSGADAGFSKKEIDFFEQEGRTEEVKYIKKLKEEYPKKNFRVKKFIRVACPTGGTTILSKRLDHFFNISLNLIGTVTGASANPVYAAMKNLLTAVISKKNDHKLLPGLEAMKPDSPFITVLNNQSSTVSIGEHVVVISGNCKTKLNLKALVIIASKLFFGEENDLVVNTRSMYNGSKRKDKLQFFFDEGTDVDHFHYFKNKKTNAAILLALRSTGTIDGFTAHFRGKVGEAERNAILGLDGGQFSTGEPSGKKPIIVLLPGIMGSNLEKSNDLVWINYLRFLTGELKRISIDSTGIEAPSLIKTSYKKLGETLQGEYDVVTFPFDWRHPLSQTAAVFDKKIKDLLKFNQPIKVIGHSMGGVLVRDFMVYHPATWKTLNESPGFKLVFLGSPLGGSFRIINVLFGEDDIISKISKLDIIHSKSELLNIFSKFPGLLSLLPFNTDANNDFSKPATWRKMADAFGDLTWPLPSDSDLANFEKYRNKILAALPNIDYSNAVYVAGQDKHTPCGYRIDDTIRGPELVLLSTGEGDQSVTWESGIPKPMIDANLVYYVSHSHGALSNAPAIFNGIKEILAKGQTNLLSRNRPVLRGDQRVFKKPETSDFDLSPEGVENTLLGISEGSVTISNELPVAVKVSHGDLKFASYPLLAGHFKNDSILYAESRIDNLLAGLLLERHKLGLYPGDIGTYEILLTLTEGFPGAIIIGLGEPDKLTAFELTRSTEQAVAKYLLSVNGREKLKTPFVFKEPIGMSSLIIGCGYGGLSIDSSVNAILEGVINANEKIRTLYGENGKLLEQVEFIELYEDRALGCFSSIRRMSKEAGGTLNITPASDNITVLNGARKQTNIDQGFDWWNRITITRQDNKKGEVRGMRFSISTGAAREDLRTVFTSTGVVEHLVESISTDNNWTREKARAVFELLIPNDFKSRLKKHGNITWVLDEYTAGFPWELLQDNSPDAKPLCINAGMIRQLVTDNSRLNIEQVTSNTALVVGDPDLKGFLTQLPGALEEAKAVNEMLREYNFETRYLPRESQETIVPALVSANYKIIHLAGHGVFDPDPEKASGMVIGENNFLTTAEIAQMSTTPELVFVNCCFLGKTDGIAEEFFQSRFKLAANIGTQLILNGVKAVVVAGWAVDDGAALIFAKKFYECMFQGKAFGEAVRIARESVYLDNNKKNTWGAYQCYGDPFYKLRDAQWSRTEKSYVIARQAEVDLYNLLSDINTGDPLKDAVVKKLAMITAGVDKCGLRSAEICEAEARILQAVGEYDKAVEKFEQMLAFEKSSYSFEAVEQYCLIRGKQLIRRLDKEAASDNLRKEFDKILADLDALKQISPSAERYSLKAGAYKRKHRFYQKGNKTAILAALGEAASNYYMAYSKSNKDKETYPFTNWIILESILVYAGSKRGGKKGSRDWGKPVLDGKRKKMYDLLSLPDIQQKLNDMRNYHLSRTQVIEYWDRMAVPNIELCTWILSVTKGTKLKQMPDSRKVRESYLKEWSIAGTKDQKEVEVHNLSLLIEALSLVSPGNILLAGLNDLKGKLETAIGV